MRTFEQDLEMAVSFHGHLCAGQVLGTRITRIALQYFGIEEPEKYQDLIAFVEADRCLADAVCSVGKCNMGRRRLKWYDYGKMAATFYDLKSGKAIRINTSGRHSPKPEDNVVEFFSKIPDDELFRIQPVQVELTEYDIPGKPKISVHCDGCGEKVLDNRHICKDGKVLCRACAGEHTYYKKVSK